MNPQSATIRLAALLLAACVALPAGCGRQSADAARREAPAAPAPEAAESAVVPSYEVLIATAAARRNRAVENCEELPGTEREACREGVEQEFEATLSGLEDSRGDQP